MNSFSLPMSLISIGYAINPVIAPTTAPRIDSGRMFSPTFLTALLEA